MVSKLVEMVEGKIEEGQYLQMAVEYMNSHIMSAIIPESIEANDKEIYIEGNDMFFHIISDEDLVIGFDEDEEEFIIEQGTAKYFLS